jgi:hypothetical protein
MLPMDERGEEFTLPSTCASAVSTADIMDAVAWEAKVAKLEEKFDQVAVDD